MKRVTNFIAVYGNKVCAYKKFWKKEMGSGVRKAHSTRAAQLRCRAFAAGKQPFSKGFFLFPEKKHSQSFRCDTAPKTTPLKAGSVNFLKICSLF